MKKLKDLVDKKVVKNIKFSTLNTKVNSFDKKISDAFISLPTSQCNTVKKSEKKMGEVENKIPDTSRLATTTVLNTKIVKLGSKFLMRVA